MGIARRRRALALAMAGVPLLLPATTTAHSASAFSATFITPAGRRVVLDYQDARNFRFTADGSVAGTWVLGGQVHLVTAHTDDPLRAERVVLIADLVPPTRRPPAQALTLQASVQPAHVIAEWSIKADVRDLRLPGELGMPTVITLARVPALAQAQFEIDRRLRAGMDMRLCGDSVDQLTAWWPPQATAQGWAVLATARGARLVGPLRSLGRTLALPPGLGVEDLRLLAPQRLGWRDPARGGA